MISGCTCGSKYKVGTGFDFVATQRTVSGMMGWFMSGYCGELGAWIGDSWFPSSSSNPKYPWLHQLAGGVVNTTTSSGYAYDGTAISPCNFCEISTTVNGNGTVSVGGTAYGKYRKAGENIGFTFTPAKAGNVYTYKVKKVLINGSTIPMSGYSGGVFNYTIQNISDDANVVVYFVPASYSATINTPSGGTVTVTVNGNSSSFPISNLQPDDVVAVTCTPNADKMVQNFVVDGMATSGGSTGPQTFTFTVYERDDDAVYNCTVTFSDRTAVTDSVTGISGATLDPQTQQPIDDSSVTCNGQSVARTNGAFMAYIGNTYLATAHEPTVFRTYNGWANGNGELVSDAYSYGWTQGSQSVAISASYTDKPLYTENLFVGTSTSDYGTGSSAVVAGCAASITRPSGESKVIGGVTYYLGGTRTVTATVIPTGWMFNGVYVSDTNASGGTKFYKANGASSVTFSNACNAIIYAIFANGESIDPSDVDQGNSVIAQSVTGLNEWEGSSSNMTMRWHSRRNIASMPMALSAARVYADSYNTSGTNDVKLKVLTFQSPDSSDPKAVETTAKSQDAYRLPMRRPEKYIEMVVTAPHQVTQIAIGTSMEALWQA